jgi:hypothetical protein
VTVNGAPTGQGIQFTPVPPPTYTVTFNEQGLPEGTTWSVTFNGVTQSSSTSSIAFTGITSGSYFFGVDTVAGYKAAPPSGTVVVSGADVSQTISFTVLPPFTYSVVFAETGLAAEQSWSVTLGGSTQSSTTSTITFTEINGTYAYTVGSIIGMKALPSSGSVTVRGAAVAVPIAWSPVVLPTYAITFTETGISAGTNWTLAVGGQSVTTSATTITVQLANGTYAYSISASGYQTATGTVTVIGAAQNIPVSVSQNTTTTSISWLDWVLIAIVIIVIIILLLVLYMRGGGKKPAPVVAKESTPSGTTTTTTTTNTTTDRTTTPSGSSTTTSTVKTRTTPDSETPPGQK